MISDLRPIGPPVIESGTDFVDLRKGEVRPPSLGGKPQCHALDADLWLWQSDANLCLCNQVEKDGVNPGSYTHAVCKKLGLVHLPKLSDLVLGIRVDTSACESCFSGCADVAADKPSLGGIRGGMLMALHADALYKNRLCRHVNHTPTLPVIPTLDAGDNASAGRILLPMKGLTDLLPTNGSTRIGRTIAARLKPTRTVNPSDNIAAPAAVPDTISDDESGSTDCELVTDDGPDDDLGEAVDREDPSDYHPIDDSLDGGTDDHDDDMGDHHCTAISHGMQAVAQPISSMKETTDAMVDAFSRESAQRIVVMVNRSMLERLGDTPGADHGNDSGVLTSSRGRVLKRTCRYNT